MSLRFSKRSRAGFGMADVLMAAAAVGGLSMVFAQLMSTMNKGTQAVQKKIRMGRLLQHDVADVCQCRHVRHGDERSHLQL